MKFKGITLSLIGDKWLISLITLPTKTQSIKCLLIDWEVNTDRFVCAIKDSENKGRTNLTLVQAYTVLSGTEIKVITEMLKETVGLIASKGVGLDVLLTLQKILTENY